MADVTGGDTGAVKAGTESAAAKSASPDPGANGSAKDTGLEARIAELTGEKKRKDEKISKLEADLAAAIDKAKTDDEKRIEQLASEKFGPQLKEAEALRGFLTAERDALIAQIPDEHKGLVLTDGVPIQQQITQARSVLTLLKGNTPPPAFSGGGNPGGESKRMYTKAEYDKWSGSIYVDRKYYDSHRDEMTQAVKDGRVEGMR